MSEGRTSPSLSPFTEMVFSTLKVLVSITKSLPPVRSGTYSLPPSTRMFMLM
ncbi:Uncharacterised protein [Mycobacterium tuberculosis]|nr:Uncharacterised protein [Mycobacterium tuberculosis]